MSNLIGTLKESSFHSALKQWYKEPGDKIEAPVDNYIIDIVRNGSLIEIQTKNFSAIKRKLENLVITHPVRLVYPIIKDKWIRYIDLRSGDEIRNRLSPKHGSYIDIFEELIRIPEIISNPNFTIELLLTQIEEIQVNDWKGGWRRKGWSISDRRLVRILERREFYTPVDFLMLKPIDLRSPFTNMDLAKSLKKSVHFARKMSYCLRKMGILKVVGKKGKAFLFDYKQL
ncbi:MAG: hypothetical protein ACXADU_17340 [Promethearchaeota archaeon]|jgi:hypothetical protein